jgi:hypothetical protein
MDHDPIKSVYFDHGCHQRTCPRVSLRVGGSRGETREMQNASSSFPHRQFGGLASTRWAGSRGVHNQKGGWLRVFAERACKELGVVGTGCLRQSARTASRFPSGFAGILCDGPFRAPGEILHFAGFANCISQNGYVLPSRRNWECLFGQIVVDLELAPSRRDRSAESNVRW